MSVICLRGLYKDNNHISGLTHESWTELGHRCSTRFSASYTIELSCMVTGCLEETGTGANAKKDHHHQEPLLAGWTTLVENVTPSEDPELNTPPGQL